MAGSIDKDIENDVSDLEKYYYYFVWKSRLDWTRHAIPVRTIDPNTGFFVEVYLQSPPNITNIEQQVVEVDLCFLTLYTPRSFKVELQHIYPTKRKLGYLDPKTNTLIDTFPGKVLFEQTSLSNQRRILNLPSLPIKDIPNIFSYYKIPFTHSELESLLNSDIDIKYIESNFKHVGVRQCLITSTMQNTYAQIEEPSSTKEVTNLVVKEETDIKDTPTISNNLEALVTNYKNCTRCSLGISRIERNALREITYPRLGKVNIDKISTIPTNVVCFIGEAPGLQEEENNITFYPKAPAGEILYKVLQASKIDYDSCYFTNSVLCRPYDSSGKSQNIKPTNANIESCSFRLKNEIAIVKPKIVVLLGKTAYRSFYGKDPKDVIGSVGWLDDEKTIYFLFHPSYIARSITYAQSDEQISKIKNDYLYHFNQIANRFKDLNND